MKLSKENRGTGKTTGLIFQAIGRAILTPGEHVLVTDHRRLTLIETARFASSIRGVAKRNGLSMSVTRDGYNVFLRSTLLEEKDKT